MYLNSISVKQLGEASVSIFTFFFLFHNGFPISVAYISNRGFYNMPAIVRSDLLSSIIVGIDLISGFT